ncbi:capsid protein [Sewage-associated circular DNA virus-36]|uniref:capsid protein n=1 Tax=Sewage-associated circular DNA virus-36 TaxID=1592103 RepID=UPI0005860891|nr:capsid protein [Sewage-associated circular DNA virus-36]AJD07518.1 capsid protein [Sewage-associated circular DNA virus-36]
MAYHRKTRRGHRSKRKTPKRLSQHMVRAIKAISQGEVETKRYMVSTDISTALTAAGYVSGNNAVIRRNFLSDLPRESNTAVNSDASFIGDQINLRGLRWSFHGSILPTVNPDAMYRFTVYRDSFYFAGTNGPGPGDRIFEQQQSTIPTWSMWNTQVTDIVFQRKFRMRVSSIGSEVLDKKFYIPLRRKITSNSDESLTINTTMGAIKGQQLYWVLEIYAQGQTNLMTGIAGTIDTVVYFKDA